MDELFQRLKARLHQAPGKALSLPGPQLRESAVLAPLYEEDGETLVVLTRRAQHLRAHRPLLDLGHEVPDDREVHVGLEQRETDLAHRLVDVVLAQLPLAAEAVEGAVQAVGQGIEHGREA